jgi:hypothetical protein
VDNAASTEANEGITMVPVLQVIRLEKPIQLYPIIGHIENTPATRESKVGICVFYMACPAPLPDTLNVSVFLLVHGV